MGVIVGDAMVGSIVGDHEKLDLMMYRQSGSQNHEQIKMVDSKDNHLSLNMLY